MKYGTEFNTPFEVGCVALESPNDDGEFAARDSDGVVCTFHVEMVEGHPDEMTPILVPVVRKGEGDHPLDALSAEMAADNDEFSA